MEKKLHPATIIIILVTVIPFSMIYNGFVLTKLWEWFIVPPFGLNQLTTYQAIGISLFINFLKPTRVEQTKGFAKECAATIAVPTFALIFGYIVFLIGG